MCIQEFDFRRFCVRSEEEIVNVRLAAHATPANVHQLSPSGFLEAAR